jgi:hypothetical protein
MAFNFLQNTRQKKMSQARGLKSISKELVKG